MKNGSRYTEILFHTPRSYRGLEEAGNAEGWYQPLSRFGIKQVGRSRGMLTPFGVRVLQGICFLGLTSAVILGATLVFRH